MKYILFFSLFAALLLNVNSIAADSDVAASEAVEALKKGDMGKVEKLIRSGFDFGKIPAEEYSEAIENLTDEQKEELLKLYYQNEAKIIDANVVLKHFVKMEKLIFDGKASDVKTALAASPVKPNELIDANGYNLLIVAAMVGAKDTILEDLLAAGIDLNHQDKSGNTALTKAILNGPPEERARVVDFLVKHGADPSIKTKAGYSADAFLKTMPKK